MKDLDRNTKQRPPGRDIKPSECLYLTFFGGGAGASVNRHIENNMTSLVWREKEKASDTKALLLPSSSVRASGFLLTYPPNVQTKLCACVDKYARRVVYGVLVSLEPA